jgi:hypothetical protein
MAFLKGGNKSAVILPRNDYQIQPDRTVMIVKTKKGIVVRAVHKETSFQKKLRKLRENKKAIYKELEKAANDPETQAYYANPENTFDDVDQEIVD